MTGPALGVVDYPGFLPAAAGRRSAQGVIRQELLSFSLRLNRVLFMRELDGSD
jgi:hypothetical protein